MDALNVGRLSMKQVGEKKLRDAVLDFVTKYRLLGFMTALPTTADFIDYDVVYLPKNYYIKEETMSTQEYLAIYFPFGKSDFYKDAHTAQWNIKGNAQRDREVLALSMAFSDGPMALNMSLQRDYAERYDWSVTQFRDLAFSLVSSILFYEDEDSADDTTLDLYRHGIAAFGGIAPAYHISLYRDKPMIVWDFHSLLRGIQMMFSFALTDEARPLRLCMKCSMAFVAEWPDDEFCGCECK